MMQPPLDVVEWFHLWQVSEEDQDFTKDTGSFNKKLYYFFAFE